MWISGFVLPRPSASKVSIRTEAIAEITLQFHVSLDSTKGDPFGVLPGLLVLQWPEKSTDLWSVFLLVHFHTPCPTRTYNDHINTHMSSAHDSFT